MICAFTFGCDHAFGIVIGQTDDFGDGSVQGWIWGRDGFGGPEVQSGGPLGDNDLYLQTESFGGDDAPGTRMAVINRDQWTGDYIAAGIGSIRLDASNLGPNFAFKDMFLRLAFSSNTALEGSGRIVTTEGFSLPRESGWQTFEFSLDMADLTAISGSNVEQVMSSVSEIRVISATEPVFIGDQFAARLGLDNITAMPVPEPTLPMLAVILLGLVICRNEPAIRQRKRKKFV